MLVKLTEVCGTGAVTSGNRYSLREVFINPEHVILVREEHRYNNLNQEGLLAEGLDRSHRFSKLTIDKGSTGTEIIVIGDPLTIEGILNSRRGLLRG